MSDKELEISHLKIQIAYLCDAIKNLERAVLAVSSDTDAIYYVEESTKRREKVESAVMKDKQ